MSRARDLADGALYKITPSTSGNVLTSDGNNWTSSANPTELPAHGTSGNILTSTGSAWASQAAPTELPAHGSDGNILTSTGSAWASEANPLPAHGTSGNVLTSTGSAWASQAAAGGGSWDLLSTTTVSSNVASVSINGTAAGFDSTKYGSYCIIFPYWQQSNSIGNARLTWLYTSGGTVSVAPRIKFSMAQHYNSYSQATDSSGNYVTIGNGDGTTLSGQVFFTLANPPYTLGGSTGPVNTGGPRLVAQCAFDNNFWGNHGNRTMITHTAANAYESYTYTGLRFYGEYNSIHKAKFYLYGIKL